MDVHALDVSVLSNRPAQQELAPRPLRRLRSRATLVALECFATAGVPRTWFALLFTAALLLFCSANEYGRLRFNSGVRYTVPATPYLFLLAAGPLLHLPSRSAAGVAILGAYWSWCLAMYRDVEPGLGILESLRHVTRGGPRLPWLSTLERMGYVKSGHATTIVLLIAAALLWALWRPRSRPQSGHANDTGS